jgi:hypothetical protein
MKFTCKVSFLFILLLSISTVSFARDHLIYSVAEEIPMGFDNEVSKKNYYMNIGSEQGVSEGTTLDVFRVISKSNPYDNLKRINYKIKIGEIKVVHTGDEAAIGILQVLKNDKETPLFDLNGFMIGDYVSVNIK